MTFKAKTIFNTATDGLEACNTILNGDFTDFEKVDLALKVTEQYDLTEKQSKGLIDLIAFNTSIAKSKFEAGLNQLKSSHNNTY